MKSDSRFDSNIIMDITLGYDKAVEEMERYDKKAISIISWIEVMAGAKSIQQEEILKSPATVRIFRIGTFDPHSVTYEDYHIPYLSLCTKIPG